MPLKNTNIALVLCAHFFYTFIFKKKLWTLSRHCAKLANVRIDVYNFALTKLTRPDHEISKRRLHTQGCR